MAILVTLLAVTALTAVAASRRSAWARRDITSRIPWPAVFITQGIAALTVLVLADPPNADPYIPAAAAVSAAAACWLAILAVVTDLSCRMIPRDLPLPVSIIGLACAATEADQQGWLSLGVSTTALVVFPFVLRMLTRGGLGFSDIRLLWALTATLSWWAGPNTMLGGLLLACLLQLCVRTVARPLRLGMVAPVPGTGEGTGHPLRQRRELPFAPAIVAGVTAAVVYAVAAGVTG